jgi:hypothetical protein
MAEVLSLDTLHDIVLPPVPALWPPGDGFWVALLLAVVIIAAGWRWGRAWQRRRAYRVAGLALLGQARTVYDVSVVLKRVALATWPREQVAPLQGADWVRFLNAACRRCHFAEDALSRPESAPEQMLLDNAARWIRGHVVHSPKMAIRHV